MRTPLIPIALAALFLAPTVALAGDRHRGGGDYHDAVRPGDRGGGHHGGQHGGWNNNHRRRHSGPSVQVVVPSYRPHFNVRVYPTYTYRPRHPVVVYGTPHWRTGRWYHGWYGGRVGWYWGVNNVYYSYETRVAAVPVAAPVAAPIEEAPVNYYCASQGQYYPTVETCPEEWTVVQAQPVVN